MKRRNKIILICVLVAVVVVLATPLIYWSLWDGKSLVEETRRELRKAGFKTELAEFDFSTSMEDQARVAALTNLGSARVMADRFQAELRNRSQQMMPELMPVVGANTAIVIWKQEKLPLNPEQLRGLNRNERGLQEDVWPALRSLHQEGRDAMRWAAEAALSGPLRFHLEAKRGSGMLLPHLAAIKSHQFAFGRAMVLELREANKEAAWTNLLAASRLVTAWVPEAAEISTVVRFACLKIAFQTLWQGLPAGWSEEQLVTLQRDWESVDFMEELPEIVAFARACAVETIRLDRDQQLQQPLPLPQLFTTPRVAWSNLRRFQEEVSYRRYGTYQEEAEAMQFYRDREAETRRAIEERSWKELRDLPVVTNSVFRSRHSSAYKTMSSLRQIAMAAIMNRSPGGGHTLLGKAADADARRRIIVTAIALERYRAKHGAYPDALTKLMPEFVAEEPIDFMDGKPLRYQLSGDGKYLLYSTGLDCVDDGGVIREQEQVGPFGRMVPGMPERDVERDLVWPRPASDAEVAAFRAKQAAASAQRKRMYEEQTAE